MSQKIAVILGTRPEITKMAPVIKEMEARGADFFILHTGQHYSYTLDGVFFEQLHLPAAKFNLEVGSGTQAVQTAGILSGVEKVLVEEKPDIVLVHGDTNSTLAGSLAASKLGTKVGHVEAGLRSYDRTMPEEINRVVADHCSDYLFAPTDKAKAILLGEGIPEERIFVTGNTIVDSIQQNLALAEKQAALPPGLDIRPGQYCLATVHRRENVDSKKRFADIITGLQKLSAELGMPVIYPVHPHSRRTMEEFGITASGLTLIEPQDFFAFLRLEAGARLILTDSGGVQEEACILKVPCITLRDNTERPETVEVGANVIAGTSPESIVTHSRAMLDRRRDWPNPLGDGQAAGRIVKVAVSV